MINSDQSFSLTFHYWKRNLLYKEVENNSKVGHRIEMNLGVWLGGRRMGPD